MKNTLNVKIFRCDEEGEPIRDANGRCTRCKPGEPGVFIGKIKKTSVANDFAGYSDKVMRRLIF